MLGPFLTEKYLTDSYSDSQKPSLWTRGVAVVHDAGQLSVNGYCLRLIKLYTACLAGMTITDPCFFGFSILKAIIFPS